MKNIADFHSHVLPGIDDGSDSLETSLAMLQRQAEQGIRHVVATPHFYARYDHPDQFLQRRSQAEAMLREVLKNYPELPAVHIGAEVRFFSGMSHSDLLAGLTIGGKKCILIEMPDVPWTAKMFRELADIRENCDLIPVIAHVDRYIRPFRTQGIPQKLSQLPVLVQANASFFLNPVTRHLALKLLRRGQIHLLGSDCHNLTSRPPNLGSAVDVIRRHLGEAPLEQIRLCQDAVLASDEVNETVIL